MDKNRQIAILKFERFKGYCSTFFTLEDWEEFDNFFEEQKPDFNFGLSEN